MTFTDKRGHHVALTVRTNLLLKVADLRDSRDRLILIEKALAALRNHKVISYVINCSMLQLKLNQRKFNYGLISFQRLADSRMHVTRLDTTRFNRDCVSTIRPSITFVRSSYDQ